MRVLGKVLTTSAGHGAVCCAQAVVAVGGARVAMQFAGVCQGAGWELVKQFWRCLLGAAVRALLWVLVGVPVLVLPVLVKMLVRVLVRLLFGVLREGRCLFGDPGQAVLLCAGEEAIWCGEVLWWLRVLKGGA